MATMTKRPGTASKSTGIRKTAPAKDASIKNRSVRAASTKMSARAAAHILPAAKGPRTISHRKIKEAVDKVFRERAHERA